MWNICHGFYTGGGEAEIELLKDGYIKFVRADKTNNGWYDLNGNKIEISNFYSIIDIKNNNMAMLDNDNNFWIMNLNNGNISIKLPQIKEAISMEEGYVLKNENNKYFFANENVSKEYEYIAE